MIVLFHIIFKSYEIIFCRKQYNCFTVSNCTHLHTYVCYFSFLHFKLLLKFLWAYNAYFRLFVTNVFWWQNYLVCMLEKCHYCTIVPEKIIFLDIRHIPIVLKICSFTVICLNIICERLYNNFDLLMCLIPNFIKYSDVILFKYCLCIILFFFLSVWISYFYFYLFHFEKILLTKLPVF